MTWEREKEVRLEVLKIEAGNGRNVKGRCTLINGDGNCCGL